MIGKRTRRAGLRIATLAIGLLGVVMVGCRSGDESVVEAGAPDTGAVEIGPVVLPEGNMEPIRLEVGSHGPFPWMTGEKRRYELEVPAGQLVHVTVEQRGIDVVVRLLDTDQNEIVAVDSPIGQWGMETVSVIADQDRDTRFLLEIAHDIPEALAGELRIDVGTPRPATDEDERRIAAERRFAKAEDLRRDQVDRDRSIEAYRGVLAELEALGDVSGQAEAWERIGRVHEDSERADQAKDAYQRAIELFRQAGDQARAAVTLNRLGAVFFHQDDSDEASRLFTEALGLASDAGDRSAEAAVRSNLARVVMARGEIDQALVQYYQIRDLWQELGRPVDSAPAVMNIASILLRQNQLRESREAFESALQLNQQAGDLRATTQALIRLGEIHLSDGDLDTALEHFGRASLVGRDVLTRTWLVVLENGLGLTKSKLLRHEEALVHFENGLRGARQQGNESRIATLSFNLSASRLEVGEHEAAEQGFRDAGASFGRLGRTRLVAASLLGEGLALRRQNRSDDALPVLRRALDHIEVAREETSSSRSRIAFHASKQRYYEELVDLLMDQPDATAAIEALAVVERSRARALLDVFGDEDPPIAAEGDQRLAADQRMLTTKLTELDFALQKAVDEGEIEQLERQRLDTLTRLAAVRGTLRRSSPQFAQLTKPRPQTLPQIQRHLDDETLLLVYSLGDTTSWLMSLTQEGELETHELPGRGEIDPYAKTAHFLLSNRMADLGGRVDKHLEMLSEWLLGPVVGRLAQYERVVVVADGGLHRLPFVALPHPTTGDPMVVSHEIVVVPSMSTLAALRYQLAGRGVAQDDAVVFANPVFSAADSRVRGGMSSEPDSQPDVTRSARDVGLGSPLPPLPGTEREARLLETLLPGTEVYMGFEANRENFLDEGLRRFQILHIATHGLLNSINPELTSLVLSIVDEEGKQQPGMIDLHDLYGMQLGAELVVLSACHTGEGDTVRGEGVIGLPRGFLYAGVPRVVYSLWSVGDQTTVELMERFYRALLEDEKSAAAALRHAQRSMQEDGYHPYQWAGFVFQGEWRDEIPERFARDPDIEPDNQGQMVDDEPLMDPDFPGPQPQIGKPRHSDETGAVGGRDSDEVSREGHSTRSTVASHQVNRTQDDDRDEEWVNGVELTTGALLPPPMSAEELLQQPAHGGMPPHIHRQLLWWVENHAINDPERQTIVQVDENKLSEAGWGVLFAPGTSPEVREALEPLISHREAQAGERFKWLHYEKGWDKLDLLDHYEAGPGPADPAKVPYYVLVVGDPTSLHYDVQYDLDIQYAVGRVHFDRVEDYDQWARAVVDAETAATVDRPTAAIFGVENDNDPTTRRLVAELIDPLEADLRTWLADYEEENDERLWDLHRLPDGRKATLIDRLSHAPPALLFTGSHGLAVNSQDDQPGIDRKDLETAQRELQGSLVCEEWVRGTGEVGREAYVAAEDLIGMNLRGMITTHFACYSAGTPQWDNVSKRAFRKGPRKLVERPFISRFAQQMLLSGAQAFVGHVDRAWATSFSWSGQGGDQTKAMTSFFISLLQGHRVGYATEYINQRYAELATKWNDLVQAHTLRGKVADPTLTARVRKATLDARNYVVIGDPAARIVGSGKNW
ncbi:MAG: CHAT domain-containing tetratricopeptide repeat protein [Acidobacteriota bacterium]